MANRQDVYKCNLCGHIVEVLHGGGGTLVCCGQNMVHLEPNTVEASKEKHIPIIERISEGKYSVKVGSVAHPMEAAHYIEWIEVATEQKSYIQFLQVGQAPEAIFSLGADQSLFARAYCNLHGLWKG
ncbi:MAG: desulfoferrodoxin [Candidatus Margulisiibacteriota bacterium]